MLNVSLRQLRYFVALVETASFSAAARRVGVTQSTLSGAIQEMEAELGARLAERSGRKFELTAAGALLAGRAAEILADVQDLPALLTRAGRPLTSRLRLGVIPSVAPFLLPRALPSLKSAFPELRLSVREALSRQLIASIRTGELDAAIIALPFAGGGFESAPFWKDHFFLGVAATHRFANRAEVAAEDLADETLLLLEQGNCLRDQVLSLTGAAGSQEGGEVKAMSLLTLVQMADNDLGVTFLPEIAIAAGVTDGADLRLIPCRGERSSRDLVLIWRERASRRHEYLLLARHLQELCEAHFAKPQERRRRRAS
ncbi:hydrogen peroxide-inducible genes activator [Hansschlegelia plantiphila]|uniref:LysR family transcriptional regulator n=1 Tax=Hansschlegelia plantiphila TaxID=374655 RepID=A0A9W6J5S1_9HYPH|nr:hydrogen peroxide-inducible genes activator [Hansschlegelia plantiphila]GLK69803.1 LysR family transcriptional regulator [Hansschlegelia plantiphila]